MSSQQGRQMRILSSWRTQSMINISVKAVMMYHNHLLIMLATLKIKKEALYSHLAATIKTFTKFIDNNRALRRVRGTGKLHPLDTVHGQES